MTVKDILEKYLRDNGYDGLCCPEEECGCLIDDLMPCDTCCPDCRPGYEQFKTCSENRDDGYFVIGNCQENPVRLWQG